MSKNRLTGTQFRTEFLRSLNILAPRIAAAIEKYGEDTVDVINLDSSGTATLNNVLIAGLTDIVSKATTEDVLDITADFLTTGTILDIASDSSDSSLRPLVRIHNDNTAATQAISLVITNDAANTRRDVSILTGTTTGEVIRILADSMTTGDVFQVSADALTTGGILNLVSDSSDTNARSLVTIKNDNTAATATTLLHLINDSTSASADMIIESTDADAAAAPKMHFLRNSASPADEDVLGKLLFSGKDDAGNTTLYASIRAEINDQTNSGTEEDGVIIFDIIKNGSQKSALELKNNEAVFNNGGADIDFRIESDDETHMFFIDGNENRVSIGDSTDTPAATLEVTNHASAGATGVPLVQLNSNDTDQIALDINATNIDADVVDITADAVTTAHALHISGSSFTSPIGVIRVDDGSEDASVRNTMRLSNNIKTAHSSSGLIIHNEGGPYGLVIQKGYHNETVDHKIYGIYSLFDDRTGNGTADGDGPGGSIGIGTKVKWDTNTANVTTRRTGVQAHVTGSHASNTGDPISVGAAFFVHSENSNAATGKGANYGLGAYARGQNYNRGAIFGVEGDVSPGSSGPAHSQLVLVYDDVGNSNGHAAGNTNAAVGTAHFGVAETGILYISVSSNDGNSEAIVFENGRAAGGIQYHDDGTELLRIFNSSSDVIFQPKVNAKDIIFQQYDGNEVLKIDDGNFVQVEASQGLHLKDLGGHANTPASGYGVIYVNGDVPYFKTDGGTATSMIAGGGASAPLTLTNSSTAGSAALTIDNNDTDQVALSIDAANIDADVIDITADAVTTAFVMDITADALTTGGVINIESNSSNTGDTRSLIKVFQDHVSAGQVHLLHLKNDAQPATLGEATAVIEHGGGGNGLELRYSGSATGKENSLVLSRTDTGSEADDMNLGLIAFDGVNDNNDMHRYINILGEASDVTDSDEGGKLTFYVASGGTAGTSALNELLSIGGEDVANTVVPAVVVNEAGINCDFRVESDGEDEAIFLDASAETLYINKGESAFTTQIHNTNDVAMSVTSAGVVFNEDGHATNDFRVETDNLAFAFYVDAGEDKVSLLGKNDGLHKQGVAIFNDFQGTTFENTLADGQFGSAEILKYSPGANDTLTSGQLYFLHTDGTWDSTDADAVATGATQMLGIGLGGSAQTSGCLIKGFMRIPSTEILNLPGSGAVDGLPLYVSTTAGHLDFTAPSGNGDFVRIVGYAIDDDSSDVLVYFNPDATHVEITA